MSVYCKCPDFVSSWHQIISAQVLANCHGICYTGEVIRYCPWCGEKIIEEDINSNMQLNLFNEEIKYGKSL